MLDLDPTLFPAIYAFLGEFGKPLLKKLAEKQVERYFGKAIEKVESLGKKDEVEAATQKAYTLWVEATLKYLGGLGYDPEDLAEYRESFEKFLEDEEVGAELVKPVMDGESWQGAEVAVFQGRWQALGLKPFPEGFQWPAALSGYRRLVQKQRERDPELREVLNAETLQAIRKELRRQGGVRPQGNEQRYAERMKEKYRVVDLSALAPATAEEGGSLRLRDVFIPQDVRENPPQVELPRDLLRKLAGQSKTETDIGEDEEALEKVAPELLERMRASYAQQPREPVLDVLGRSGSQRIVILGDPGAGKSTLTRYVLLSLLEPPLDPLAGQPPAWLGVLKGTLPLLVEVREFIARRGEGCCQTFLEFMHYLAKTQGYHVHDLWLEDQLRSRPCLVMFDGIDEVFDPAEHERIAQEIAGFGADYPQARIVVTSRPVGYKDGILKNAGFRHFALQDLDNAQVQTFVRGWFGLVFPGQPEEAELRIGRILRAAEQSNSIRLLAGNPMLLTIMVLMARQQELPRERSRLYEYSAEVLCYHWDMNRHLRDAGFRAEYIGVDDKKELLRRVAFRMQSAEQGLAGNFIHGDDLQEEFKSYFVQRYQEKPGDAKVLAEALINQLRARNFILCLYGPGLYGFVHRTFLEYFCAAEFVCWLQEKPDYTIDCLIEEVYIPHWRDPAWQEVLRLICGMVGEAYADRIIGYLTTSAYPEWKSRARTFPPRNLNLAIQCLGEVRNRHSIQENASRLLREVVDLLGIGHFGIYSKFSELIRDVLEGAREVGSSWPNREYLRENFRDRLVRRVGEGSKESYALLTVYLFPGDSSLREDLFSLANSLQASQSEVRIAALWALIHGWPQSQEVQDLLIECARKDQDHHTREVALQALVQTWPQSQEVHDFLVECAQQDPASNLRKIAILTLFRGWPKSQDIQKLLIDRAQQDQDPDLRKVVIMTLFRGWPQSQELRDLLTERARQDQHPNPRTSALQALSQGWPKSQEVLDLLIERTRQDQHPTPRGVALRALARGWPQSQELMCLFIERARQDQHPDPRGAALQALAQGWPRTQELLDLLIERARQDQHPTPRRAALRALAQSWPQSQELLNIFIESARQDQHSTPRSTALRALTQGWPQSRDVLNLLAERARQDEHPAPRGRAMGGLAKLQLDQSAVVLISLTLNGLGPYLDPRKPLPIEHIQKAARKLKIEEPALKEQIAEYSKVLGWDLLEGLRPA